MNWKILVDRPAIRALNRIPKRDVERIQSALRDMESSPFSGDIVRLQGIHKGSFRRRIGSWRLFFDVDTQAKTVAVRNIMRRTSKTY